jgi:predicted peptidase
VLPKVQSGVQTLTATFQPGKNLRYAISIPPGHDGKTPVPLVVALHYGYDGAAPDPSTGQDLLEAFAPGLADLGAIVVAPVALGGDWTDPTNESAVVWLTKSVMKSYPIDPKRVVLTGYSLGGQGTWFLAGRHQDLFTAAIPVAGEPTGGNLEWKIPVYVIHSEADEIIPIGPARKHTEALKAKGAKVEFKPVTGLTHYQTTRYGPYLKDAVKWLRGEWK